MTAIVPGEDFRAKALEFERRYQANLATVDDLAALLSSTAALAREEAATKAELVMQAHLPHQGESMSDACRVAAEIASAIRAIGKEG